MQFAVCRPLALLTLFLSSCAAVAEFKDARPEQTDSRTGRLVAFRLEYYDRSDQDILVDGRYGLLVVCNDTERLFCLFDNVKKRILATQSWDKFYDALVKWPDGIEVQRFNTCCAPIDYRLPDAQSQSLDAVMRMKEWRWRVDPVSGLAVTLVCTCESKDRRYPPL